MNSSLGLIVKVTRNCNLRCAYCHDWWMGPGSRMRFEVAAHVVAKALEDESRASVHFMWHGGETLILPVSFYQRVLLLQSIFRKPGQLIRNSIQTNATLITHEWAEFLKANHFNVGVSLDGPREVHDAARVDARGGPTFDRVVEGIRTLREAGVRFSVLMVADDRTIERGPAALFAFLRELNLDSAGVIAAKPVNRPDTARIGEVDHYVPPTRFNQFLCQLYNLCYPDRATESEIRIRELEAIRSQLLGSGPATCTLAGNCFGQYYSIEPDGEVAHCDLFIGDRRYTLGNILHSDFAQLTASPALDELKQRRARDVLRMHGCRRFNVCQGWCPHEQYLAVRHDVLHDPACCGLLPLIDHIEAEMAGTVGVMDR